MNDLSEAYYKSFAEIHNRYADQVRAITSSGPGMAARVSGQYRKAARLDIESETAVEVGAEGDATLRELKLQRGRARARAFDVESERADTETIEESGYLREAFVRKSRGDIIGSLESRQRARRVREFGVMADLSTPSLARAYIARAGLLSAQEDTELQEARADVGLRKATIARDVAVSGLEAAGKPRSADVESILRKAVIGSNRLRALGFSDEADSELQIGQNQLRTYQRHLQTLGTAVETAPGAFGPSGTEGGGGRIQETDKELADKIESALRELGDRILSGLSGDGM